MDRIARSVAWHLTGDSRTPLRAAVDGELWVIRISEFPEADTVYVLLVDGRETERVHEWPAVWRRAAATESPAAAGEHGPHHPDDAYEKGVYDSELARYEHSRAVPPSKLVEGPGRPRRPPP